MEAFSNLVARAENKSNDSNFRNECTLQTCPIYDSYYNYRPSLAANGIFLALFAFSLCCYLLQFGLSRRFIGFSIALASGCILEVLGYIGRIMSYYDPFNQVCGVCTALSNKSILILIADWILNANCLPDHCAGFHGSRLISHPFPYRYYLRPRKLSYRSSVISSHLYSLRCPLPRSTGNGWWNGFSGEPHK